MRQKTKDKRQKTRDKRQETGDRRQETSFTTLYKNKTNVTYDMWWEEKILSKLRVTISKGLEVKVF